MKKSLLIFSVFSLLVSSLKSQNSDYETWVNHVFQHVNKNTASTGLLKDYGVEFIDMSGFDGIPKDSNYVDFQVWQMLYSGIYSCRFGANAVLTYPQTVFNTFETLPENVVPVMHFNYQVLREDALSLGYVTVNNEQIRLVSGKPLPYLNKELFAVAPKHLLYDGPLVSFLFRQDCFYSNTGQSIQKIEINFDNESGFLQAAWNQPLTYTFSSGGKKTLVFRVTYANGTVRQSRTNIYVKRGSADPVYSTPDYHYKRNWLATSEHSGGNAYVRYGDDNPAQVIRKPLIIVEGYEISSVLDGFGPVNENIEHYLEKFSPGEIVINGENIKLKNSVCQIFDIIYIDYTNGVDDIRRNAKFVEECIDWINANKQSNEPNIVLGSSMGGLVARYALRKMELSGKNHDTWKFISADSPHKGATIPLSVQALIRQFAVVKQVGLVASVALDRLFDLKDYSTVFDILDAPATRQLLIYRLNENMQLDNQANVNLIQELDQMGFPENCQNIAMSNGDPEGRVVFPPDSEIINFSYSQTLKWWMDFLSAQVNQSAWSSFFSGIGNVAGFLNNLTPSRSEFRIQILAKALKNQQSSKICQTRFYIHKRILFLTFNADLINLSYTSPALMPIDGAPGSHYPLNLDGKLGQFVLGNILRVDKISFVPTVSSLALHNWQSHLTSNLSQVDFYANGDTPFEDYYLPNSSEPHVNYATSATFLYNHLVNNSIAQYRMSGPDFLSSCQADYLIRGLHANITNPRWSVTEGLRIVQDRGINGCKVERVVSANPAAPYTSTIKFMFEHNGQTHSKEMLIQTQIEPKIEGIHPYNWYIPGSSGVVRNKDYYFASNSTQTHLVENYEWNITSYNYSQTLYGQPSIPVSFQTPGFYNAALRLRDGCGWGNYSQPFAFEVAFDFVGGGGLPFDPFPNPTSSVLYFEKNEELELQTQDIVGRMNRVASNPLCRIEIYALKTGNLVFKRSLPNFDSDFEQDMSFLSNGLYMVRLLKDSEVIQTNTISVER